MRITDYVENALSEKSGREKWLLIGAVIVVIFLILFLLLFRPLLEQQRHLQMHLGVAQQQHEKLLGLSEQATQKGRITSLNLQQYDAILRRLMRQLDLSENALKHIDGGTIIRFESVDFNKLIQSINTLVSQGVGIEQLSISTSNLTADGTVKGEIQFKI